MYGVVCYLKSYRRKISLLEFCIIHSEHFLCTLFEYTTCSCYSACMYFHVYDQSFECSDAYACM